MQVVEFIQSGLQFIENDSGIAMRSEFLFLFLLAGIIRMGPAMHGDLGNVRHIQMPCELIGRHLGNDRERDRSGKAAAKIEQRVERGRRLHRIVVPEPEIGGYAAPPAFVQCRNEFFQTHDLRAFACSRIWFSSFAAFSRDRSFLTNCRAARASSSRCLSSPSRVLIASA